MGEAINAAESGQVKWGANPSQSEAVFPDTDEIEPHGITIMFDDWIDLLLRGSYQIDLPSRCVSAAGRSENCAAVATFVGVQMTGFGLQAVTDGGRTLEFGSLRPRVHGRNTDSHSTFLTFSGRTQSGWNVATYPDEAGRLQPPFRSARGGVGSFDPWRHTRTQNDRRNESSPSHPLGAFATRGMDPVHSHRSE